MPPEASRTHLHEAVCVWEARQHHLPGRLGRARGRLGLGLSGTGGRHFSGWRGSSRESASVSATCAHCACAEAVPAGGGLGSWDTGPPPHPRLPHAKGADIFHLILVLFHANNPVLYGETLRILNPVILKFKASSS